MAANVTQQDASSFRGIQDWMLIPFATTPVSSSATPLPGNITTLSRVSNTYNYLDQNVVDVTIGTQAYLCYGRALRSAGNGTGIDADNFIYGHTEASFEGPSYSGGYTPASISFSPSQICSTSAFAADVQGAALLAYLNAIASASVTESSNTYTWSDEPGLQRVFQTMANYDETNTAYQPFAGSSASIMALVTAVYNSVAARHFNDGTWQKSLQTEILNKIKDGLTQNTDYTIDGTTGEITITSLGSDAQNHSRDGFPASSGLPDGAAAIRWNTTTSQFEYITTTTITPTSPVITSYEQLVYPAELWYYANSSIQTSTASQADKYNNEWTNVLGNYTSGTAVALDTRSIAIVNPLQYGVGCVEFYVQTPTATLNDAKGTAISLTHTDSNDNSTVNNFPLTAIFLGGQYQQNFDFTPVSTGTEGILYDSQVGYNAGTGLGTINLIQDTKTEAAFPVGTGTFYTLSLQTREDESVTVILEFQNNSGEPFYGKDGVVAPGMRFYLVGIIAVPGSGTPRCVVVQDHKSQFIANVASLANAYNVIPDLQNAANTIQVVNVGIRQWVQAGNQEHPVFNW